MKQKINGYSFGKMAIGEKEFSSDLIIYPDGHIEDNWWRESGHNLAVADIIALLDAAPEKIVVGTGANGLMKVSQNVISECKGRSIEVEALPTAKAVATFNQVLETETVVAACFHLTC